MVYFIQQSLELRISKQWFLLFNSHYNKVYQNSGFCYSTGTRTKYIKTMVSFIQQSLELRIYPNGFFHSTVTRIKDIKTIVYFIQQSL